MREARSVVAAGAGRLARTRARLGRTPPLVEYVAADIVNNCNLRCPFCLVDYEPVRHTQLMDEATFGAMLRLAPAVPDGGFWLSCLHEPTLHPRLGELIETIPLRHRRKFWFTTNLARPLPDALLETLTHSGLHHINVSLDTFDEDLFKVLRKHGRVSVFRDNLDRFLRAMGRAWRPIPIRYITMAFRSNLAEIPDLVRWMNEHGRAREIEIRHTYNTSNISDEFRQAHYNRPEDWAALRERLAALPYRNIDLVTPPAGDDAAEVWLPANNFDYLEHKTEMPAIRIPRPLRLRIRSDGRLHLSGQEDLFGIPIQTLDDPVAFLQRLSDPGRVPEPGPGPVRSSVTG